MVTGPDGSLEISEFELHLRNNVHFHAGIFGKKLLELIFSTAMDLMLSLLFFCNDGFSIT